MDTINNCQTIASLFIRKQANILSEAENKQLLTWLQESEENRKLYERLLKKEFSSDLEFYQNIDTSRAWKRYTTKYPHWQKSIKTLWLRIAIAACLTAVIVSSVILFSIKQTDNRLIKNEIIPPGGSKALLITSNGKSIDLTLPDNATIMASENISAKNNGTEINYYTEENKSKTHTSEIFNEIIVPRGGEYKITLSDGTRVWLNSQSKLRYPVTFDDKERKVELQGEAYFEVEKSGKKPFLVHANRVTVRVLGTSFNVRAYADENIVETVLEKGKVTVESPEKNIALSPSHLFAYNTITQKTTEKQVDTELYTAWRSGRYVFYNESIENILNKLARWYDMKIEFKDERVKHLIFSGNIRKYENVNTLLNALESSGGIYFETRNNIIIVGQQ